MGKICRGPVTKALKSSNRRKKSLYLGNACLDTTQLHIHVKDLRNNAFLPNPYTSSLLFSALLWSGFTLFSFNWSFPSFSIRVPDEICDNGLDDDNDGLIDLNDPDCACQPVNVESLIPNPSFEERTCCPEAHSQLYCSDDWIQASEATTDYIHSCGWLGWEDFPPPLPFPDGTGAIGFRGGTVLEEGPPLPYWKEYAGACLIEPLEKDTLYRFEFDLGFINSTNSPPIEITLFGSYTCDFLPFGIGNIKFGCPTNDDNWFKITSAVVQADGTGRGWVQSAFEFTPSDDIYSIAIGPPCELNAVDEHLYYLFDNLILADRKSFDFKISKVGNPCSDNFTLRVPDDPTISYQWYKEGVALPGETNATLGLMRGEGLYQVRLIRDMECKLASINFVIPTINTSIDRTICGGEGFIFDDETLTVPGTYTTTLNSVSGCDSIVSLDLKVLGFSADTVRVRIFEGESYDIGTSSYSQPGEYLTSLQSSLGCDSLVYLFLDYYEVFFPNAFSPNDDGINDHFNAFGPAELTEVVDLKIFDRWGGLMYQGQNLPPQESAGWDGRNQGKLLNTGVYVYVATVLMDDGIQRQFSGSLLLVQ